MNSGILSSVCESHLGIGKDKVIAVSLQGSRKSSGHRGYELPFMSQWGKDARVFLQAGALCGTPTQRAARRSSAETGWSSKAQVGGKLQEERRGLFLGVAVQGRHQEGHLQNPLKSARRGTASCLHPLVRGEAVLSTSSLCWVLCPLPPLSWSFLLSQKMLLGMGVW